MDNDEATCSLCNSLVKTINTSVKIKLDPTLTSNLDENRTEFELNPSSNTNNLMAAIDTLNIPKIQKIMMKECLKTSTELDGQKSIKFSKTWIFLCVLLYIESPRMYRYFINKNISLCFL